MRCRSTWSVRVLGTGILGMGLGGLGCSSVQTCRASTAHFEQYRTLSFELSPEPPTGSDPTSIETQARVERAVEAGLEHRGYLLIAPEEPADLVVLVRVGRRQTTPPSSIGIVRGARLRASITGLFVVDAFERATENLVWRGSATTDVDLSQLDHDGLKIAVAAVLASFPARVQP